MSDSPNVTRKLAAIMFTDIAGYTALSAKDENKSLNLLDKQKQILTPIIEEYNGTLHKEIGDGLLFTFPTVTEAVKCGIKIQEESKAVDDLNLRIGIHEGEITLKDGDALGDDVNVASRIEPFSAIGGVAISGKVQQNISSLSEFETKYIGKPQLKGVTQEVKVFCITSHNLPETDVSQVSTKLEKENISFAKKILFPATGLILTLIGGAFWFIYPFLTVGIGNEKNYDASIAILYMENISEEENNYFADGLTEELINRLTRIQNLKVKPRTDVAVYKDTHLSINQIAKDLNVDYIVEGSVRIVDENLRVNAKLINTLEDITEWSESYDNKLLDIFNVQDEIAGKIVSQLNEKLNISKTDISATKRASTQNLEAYNLVQQAVETLLNQKISGENTYNIISPLLEKAVALDSTYADALTYLAVAKITRYEDEEADDYVEMETKAFGEASILVEKALLYEPDHELSLGLSIIMPLIQMQIDGSENYDLFMMRKLAIQLDGYISKYPDSPFALSLSGMYYAIKYEMLENEADIELALENMLKSHSILKNSIFKIKDPLQEHANFINFEQIPVFLYLQDKLDEALKFISDNKQMVCLDGTYSCLTSNRLQLLQNGFYQSFQYNEAIELVELSLSRSEDELSLEGADLGIKEQAYYRYGMINMKWGEYTKAIEGFSNALKINEKYITSRGDSLFWNSHNNRRLGLTYNLMGEYKKASQYYYKSYKQESKSDEENSEFDAIKSICPHGYMEILLDNHESAKNSISECVEWLNNNPERIDDDTGAYSTYFPLCLYYGELNDKTNAEKYLELAYKAVKEEKIKKFHANPNRDKDPKYFYCRSIINAYERNKF